MATYDLKYPGAAIDAILDTAYHLQQAGYIFRGSASDYSGTPTEREWVIAPAGFSGLGLSSAVPQGSFGICLYNGTSWTGKIVNVLTLDSQPTRNSQNGVTSGGVAATLDEIAGGIMATFASLLFDDETASADLSTKLSYAVKFSVSDVYQTVTHLNILAATTSKAGLMSAEDKAKVDSFLTNLRSLTFSDTTASADQATQITETVKATIGGVQEVIDSITLLAATSSKAGLLSAADKAYIDALPATLTSLSNSISGALALMQSLVGYYVCDTAAGTAAKTVSASGYVLTTGGCIRIKMTNANTADNVTLNINSTGAKALYYDGAQASATNTWEAGEVLEVYYDGTQYQCAKGGGKADELYDTELRVTKNPLTDYMTESYYIRRSDNELVFSNSFLLTEYVPVLEGTILAWSGLSVINSTCSIGFYDSNKAVVSTVTTASGSMTVPNNAVYARFSVASNSSPSVSLYVTQQPLPDRLNTIENDIDGIDEELGGMRNIAYNDLFHQIPVSVGYIDSTGNVATTSYVHTDYIEIVPNTLLIYSGLSTNGPIYNITFYDSQKARVNGFKGASGRIIAPATAKYIRLSGAGSDTVSFSYTVNIGTVLERLSALELKSEQIDALNDAVQVDKDSTVYGSTKLYNNNTSLYNWFSTANSAALISGYLRDLTVAVNTAGNYIIAVGLLDQDNNMVNARKYEMQLAAGINVLNVSDKKIGISVGEQVFLGADGKAVKYGWSNKQEEALHTGLVSRSEYGFVTQTSTTYVGGLVICLNWTITKIDGVFAPLSLGEENAKNIEIIQTQISTMGFVYDNDGVPYIIRVVNGQLQARPYQFSHVLVLGNSLSCCPADNINWWTDDAPMACTRRSVGWTTLLQRILRQKNANAVVDAISLKSWEVYLTVNATTMANLTSYLANHDASTIDCIIFRLSENAHPGSKEAFVSAILDCLTYIQTQIPNAEIIMTTGMWIKDNYKDAALVEAAMAKHLTVVYPKVPTDLQFLGAYVEGDDAQLHKITDSGVAGHVNDVGFMKFANTLADTFGYTALNELHNVTIVNNNNLAYTALKKCVYGGIFTIKTDAASCSAVDAQGNNIAITSVDGGYVFDTPNSDVTVTISN